jgi:NAD(P)-dependent dehydrogenase (short-subunit alcohol dehydrogenase family)
MDDTTVVVTGGTRGVGRAVSRAFAEHGADVILCGRSGDEATETASAIDADSDGTVVGIRADVRDEYDMERLMETGANLGEDNGIDVVVANAAVLHGNPGEMSITEESYSAFDDTVRTNVRGVFTTFRESLPHLADDAHLLVPSGSVAREAKPGLGGYAVSKAGAEAVARQFDADTDATAFVLDLGLVATELTGDGSGRDPEDVAPMFTWAATEADTEEHSGDVIDLRTWKRASR